MNRDLISLSESRVALKPHQVAVVHRVVTSYPHRFLLCDEVGLGKTIEAGIILKELRARKSADRVLIIVPPNLMRQWQFELKTKFNEAVPDHQQGDGSPPPQSARRRTPTRSSCTTVPSSRVRGSRAPSGNGWRPRRTGIW